MCLILLAWRAHPRYPLIFAGNRDESYDRPSAAPDFWPDAPGIFGGRDMEKGGTWLGLARPGRVAAVTNFRERPHQAGTFRSRGELTADYLRGSEAPRRYLERVAPVAAEYRPFSLLVGDGESLYYLSNRAAGRGSQALAPGVYGLSNHLLDTPWPKIVQGKARLGKFLSADEPELVAGLYEILLDRSPAADADLPDTGIGRTRERELSALFIPGEHYGTRASTVVLIDRDGGVLFIERAYGPRGTSLGITEKRLTLRTNVAPAASAG